MVNKEEIKEFFELCRTHDWFYSFSDDGRIYRKGLSELSTIIAQAKKDPMFDKIYTDWSKYVTSGKAYGTRRRPKPLVEDYIIKELEN